MSGHGQTQAGHALSPIEEMVSCYPTFNNDIYPYLHQQVLLEFHGLSNDCKYTQEYMAVWAWYAQARSKWFQKDEGDEYQQEQEHHDYYQHQHENESIGMMLHRDGTERQKFEREAYPVLHQWAQTMYNDECLETRKSLKYGRLLRDMVVEYSNLLKYTLTPPTATHYPDTRYMNIQYQAPDTRYPQHSNPQNTSSQPFELH
ncbi:hypothetical protein LQW54_007639 [Pestalotiopsis sp. IQ-011]